MNNIPVEPWVDDGYASDHVEIAADDEKRTDPGNKKEKHRLLFSRMGRSMFGSTAFKDNMWKQEKLPFEAVSMWPYYYN